MSTFNLFVYGTLRRGGGADGMLHACEHAGAATVGGMLYDIDGLYPALLMYGATPVRGEIWTCPASLLEHLDEYEGIASGLFRRVATEAIDDEGVAIACWLYTAGPALSQKLVPENRIRSGTWPRAATQTTRGPR